MKIIGHRGAKSEAPENTLAGFAYLRSLGINHVELDVYLSADQELVVIHDDTVDRTTGQSGKVRNFSAMALSQMKAFEEWPGWSQSHPDFNQYHQGIPTLHEILADWPELESIQLEVKPAPDKDLAIVAREIIKLCQDFKLEDRGIITSSSKPFHQFLNELNSPQASGLVADDKIVNPVETARSLNCDYLCLDWKLCNEEIVKAAARAGLIVSLWTVNDTSTLNAFRKWKIDGVITDIPSEWLKVI